MYFPVLESRMPGGAGAPLQSRRRARAGIPADDVCAALHCRVQSSRGSSSLSCIAHSHARSILALERRAAVHTYSLESKYVSAYLFTINAAAPRAEQRGLHERYSYTAGQWSVIIIGGVFEFYIRKKSTPIRTAGQMPRESGG